MNEKFPTFQETEAPKRLLLFQEVTFKARKMKNTSYISGRNFKVPSLKKILLFLK